MQSYSMEGHGTDEVADYHMVVDTMWCCTSCCDVHHVVLVHLLSLFVLLIVVV